MPRNQPRKTAKGSFSEAQMKEAVDLVNQGRSIRSVAKEKGLSFQTIARYVKKQKEKIGPLERMTPNYAVNRVFSKELEESLSEYFKTCSKMFYGLPKVECRKLTYQLAVANNLKFPESWNTHQMAGADWLYGFIDRNPGLSMRTPESCSLSRATSFNKHNVNIFFDNLEIVMKRSEDFGNGTRVYNLDETSTFTVQKPQCVLAEKGVKQVSKVTSSDKGTLVTTCCIVSASGNSIPPVMVFPRVNFKDHMLNGAPPGSLGLANKSGWMNADLFIKVMEHFIKHTKSTTGDPTLLIFDNHESHLSLQVLNLAKDNGVHILTIPPHSSAKLQPLDVAVFKPFKVAYNSAVDSWMMQHPGKAMSIYQVAACVGVAHEKAVTPSNIIAGFRKCGIFPYDRLIFTETDFMSSAVMDRPPNQEITLLHSSSCTVGSIAGPSHISSSAVSYNLPQPEGQPTGGSAVDSVASRSDTLSASISNNLHQRQTQLGQENSDVITPEGLLGYPKAGERCSTSKGRKWGRSMIATDTPEKLQIEEKSIGKKKLQKVAKKKPTRKLGFELSSEGENDVLLGSSDSDDSLNIQPDREPFPELEREPTVGDYVLIQFSTDTKNRQHSIFYIANIIAPKDEQGELTVFYRRATKSQEGSSIQLLQMKLMSFRFYRKT